MKSCSGEAGRWIQDQEGEFVWVAPSTFTVSTLAIEHLLVQLIMFSHGTCKLSSLITSLSFIYFQCKLFGKRLKKRENSIFKKTKHDF